MPEPWQHQCVVWSPQWCSSLPERRALLATPPPIAAPAMGADGIPVGSPGPGMAGSPRTFHMKLPADARRGQKIQVRAPSGELMVFKVPRGARPGQTLHFPY